VSDKDGALSHLGLEILRSLPALDVQPKRESPSGVRSVDPADVLRLVRWLDRRYGARLVPLERAVKALTAPTTVPADAPTPARCDYTVGGPTCIVIGEHEDDGDGMIRHEIPATDGVRHYWRPKPKLDAADDDVRCTERNPGLNTRCRYAVRDARHEANDDDCTEHQDRYGYNWMVQAPAPAPAASVIPSVQSSAATPTPLPVMDESPAAINAARLALMRRVGELEGQLANIQRMHLLAVGRAERAEKERDRVAQKLIGELDDEGG